MPTGYTHALEKMNYDVRRWVKESVVRGMGICVMLRDSGSGLGEEDIKKALRADSDTDDYHSRKLAAAKTRLAALQEFTERDWATEYQAAQDEAAKSYETRLLEHNTKKEAHIKATHEAEALLKAAQESGAEEGVTGTLQFAVSQLNEAFHFDYGHSPYREEVLDQTLDDYKSDQIKKAEHDIAYHAREGGKRTTRGADRYKAYCDLVAFVNSQ